ncbi:PadR family transcriptional regulator [Nocardioides sp. Soil797]|nr:PadR family transcriptional regulator [Nocardioides sp. Soil797]
MALEHALLVSLSERTASGLELTRRFDRSIGHFWTATHQQIYRVLGRMEKDGWVRSETVAQQGRPDKKVYEVTEPGRLELERWIAEPTAGDPLRSSLMVKFRGASYGDRAALLEQARERLDEHNKRLALYEHLVGRDYADPSTLDGHDLDAYLVLRGGVRLEQFWIDWLTEYLDAWTKESR